MEWISLIYFELSRMHTQTFGKQLIFPSVGIFDLQKNMHKELASRYIQVSVGKAWENNYSYRL